MTPTGGICDSEEILLAGTLGAPSGSKKKKQKMEEAQRMV
jgi:hypothetical protein